MNMYLAKGYSITIGHCFSMSWRHKLIYINNYTLIPYHLHPIKRGNFKQLLKRPWLIWVSINVWRTDLTPPPHLILPLMRCHSFGTLQQHCNMKEYFHFIVGLCCCILWPSFLFNCVVKIWATCENFLGKRFTAPALSIDNDHAHNTAGQRQKMK